MNLTAHSLPHLATFRGDAGTARTNLLGQQPARLFPPGPGERLGPTHTPPRQSLGGPAALAEPETPLS